jgi:hypothetical protein
MHLSSMLALAAPPSEAVSPLIPPGGLFMHMALVLVTPALLAWSGALLSVLCGRGRIALVVAGLFLLMALGLSALFLRPDGALTAFTDPLLFGFVRSSWPALIAVPALGLLLTLRWFPRHDAPWTWCMRVGIGMSLPLVACPVLWLGVEGDHGPQADRSRIGRIALLSVAQLSVFAAMLMGFGLWLVPLLMVLCHAFVAATCAGPWRWIAAALAVVAVAEHWISLAQSATLGS